MYKTRLDVQEKLIMPTPKVKALLRTQILGYINKVEKDADRMDVDGEENAEEVEEAEGDVEDQVFVLRIQGKVKSIYDEPKSGFYRKFSYFFNKIQIKFDGEEYQDIEWVRQNNSDTDGFEIKRPAGVEPIKVRILFYLNSNTQEYKLSDELSEILGVSQATRPHLLNQIWQYIKINSLQDLENPNVILNNVALQRIFKCEKMDVNTLIPRLFDHLRPCDPIEVDYEIGPDSQEKLYDIVVNIDDPHFLDISNFLSNSENESILFPKSLFYHKSENQKTDKYQQSFTENFYNKLQEYDRNAADLIEKFKKHKYKYDFYEMYAKDPIKFINNFMVQQNSLLKIMKEESSIIDARWDYNSAQYYKDYEVTFVLIILGHIEGIY
jgi:chromatin remodeling complex protein RSC6